MPHNLLAVFSHPIEVTAKTLFGCSPQKVERQYLQAAGFLFYQIKKKVGRQMGQANRFPPPQFIYKIALTIESMKQEKGPSL